MRGCVISKTLDGMLQQGYGYRTESFSGSGVRRIDEVIRYELSLGNTDIVEFCQTNHQILKDICVDEEFWAEIENLDVEEQQASVAEELSHICQENAPYIVEEIVKFAMAMLGVARREELFALWLTTADKVVELYGGNTENVEQYSLHSARYLVISDLGEAGALFVL